MGWRKDPRTWLALVGTLLLWASAFAGIREGMQVTAAGAVGPGGYGPGEVALLRFGTASAVLAVFAVLTRMRLPRREDLLGIAVAGVVGITGYHVPLNFGELTVNSGAAALLIAAGPVFVALMSMGVLHERLSKVGWLGILVAFAGTAVISVGGEAGLRFSAGALLVLLAAFTTAIYFVLSKRLLARYSPLEFTCYAIWAGTIPMLVFAPTFVVQAQHAVPSATLSVIYLGIFPAAIAYVLSNYALARMPASIMTTFLYLSPVLAGLIAWLWRGEVPTALTVAGGVVVIAGVVVVQTWGSPGRPASSTPQPATLSAEAEPAAGPQ
jgi:drug/metabolite transporter (DMT)-like permease